MNHLNLLKRIAWSFHYTTGTDWKELFSEACLAYCEALNSNSYNKDKSKESTWIYNCVTNGLINFLKKELRETEYNGRPITEADFDWIPPGTIEPDYEYFGSRFEQYTFSEDVFWIIRMVLHDPIRYAKQSRAAFGQIRKDLREKKGWISPRINAGMRSLRIELNEINYILYNIK